jgi:metacaspase-1
MVAQLLHGTATTITSLDTLIRIQNQKIGDVCRQSRECALKLFNSRAVARQKFSKRTAIVWTVSFFFGLALFFAPLRCAGGQSARSPDDKEQLTTHRRALLIGVSDYHRETGSGAFYDINTGEDVRVMRDVLVTKFRFSDQCITQLTSKKETSRDSIIAALRSFFVDNVEPGDVLFFYYAGHGSQVPDPDEPDGFDETLVPSDYTDDGSKDIRDKEIAEILSSMSTRHPANVMLGFDCCHSATITRADTKLRGLSWHDRSPDHPFLNRSLHHPTLTRGERRKRGFVVFSACRDDAPAHEMKNEEGVLVGRLSFFLSRALLAATSQTTYRQLFDKIVTEMAQRFPDQVPTIEGDEDEIVFSGSASETPRYMLVNLSPDGKNNYILNAGKLEGMTEGSEISLFPPGPLSFAKENRIAMAKVTEVRAKRSVLSITNEFKENLTPQDLSGAYAIETSHQYGDERLKLDERDFVPLRNSQVIVSAIRKLPSVDIKARDASDPPDIRLMFVTEPDIAESYATANEDETLGSIPALVRSASGQIIEPLQDESKYLTQIDQALLRESKYRALLLLNNASRSSGVLVEMRVVPAKVKESREQDEYEEDDASHVNDASFIPGDWLTVDVRNVGSIDAYLTLLALLSDGSVEQVWPVPGELPDNKLTKENRGWHKLWSGRFFHKPRPFKIYRPYGTTVFKLIATKEQVDFTNWAERALRSPMEQLLATAYFGMRQDVSIPPTDWSTSTAVFTVNKK